MTQAQKIAKDKFKKAIEYRKKTGVSLKDAFAHIYGKKVGAVKKKAAPKKKAASKKVTGSHKDTKSHNVNIRVVSGYKKVGALPIDFKGNFQGYRFKVINQYQLDGGVTAQLVELDGRGNIIAELSGNPKENDRVTATLLSGATFGGQYKLDEKDKKDLQKRIKSFVVGLNKEVLAFNSGKDISKKRSKGLKIVYKPETKKLAIVDQIKSILKNNKKILKGGYAIKSGSIREKKIAGMDVINGINDDILKELKSIQQREIYFNDLLQKQLFEESALKSQTKGKSAGIAKAQLIATRRYIKDLKNILMRLKKQKIALKKDIK